MKFMNMFMNISLVAQLGFKWGGAPFEGGLRGERPFRGCRGVAPPVWPPPACEGGTRSGKKCVSGQILALELPGLRSVSIQNMLNTR